ncbi:MAG TPA: hypothetical protein DCE56_16370 [Cyanobacteria bacterium UBA8553]|nr:hypothetical protein [Cyanobacteria bacterium UBA8553]
MLSPKQIIEDIRKNTYGIGLETDQAAKGVIDSLKKSLNSALERLSVDLYSKETHFVLELIQNADDNQYQYGVSPTLTLTIEPQKIIVQNNEIGFTEANVRAICNVGASTKTKVQGYIGEKGIGFKSVFRISDEPQIFSKEFQFKFNRQNEKDQLGFVAPHWIDLVPQYVEPTLTNIVLPLRESAKDELEKLGQVEHTLILFLRQLKTVEIENKINQTISQITRIDKNGKIKIYEFTGTSVKKYYYKLLEEKLTVPDSIQEEKRENVKATKLILAFSLKEDGSANTEDTQEVFAFLPTRSYGFKFLIQADFLVPANREDIHKDTRWNKWIRDNIATTFLLAVEEFKQDSNLQKTYYNYIPLKNEVTEEFFSPVVNEIHNRLKANPCILTESGNWNIPSDVLLVDEPIRDLISNNDLQQLLKKEYIHPEVKAKAPVLESIGVKKFNLDDLVKCLQNVRWLETQSDDWFIKLHIYLKSLNLSEYSDLPKVKQLKIIRLQNDKLASTAESSIFFPLNQNGEYGFEFEQELQFVKTTLLPSSPSPSKEAVTELLKKLGVQNASPYEIIEDHILPLYQGDAWKSKGNQLLGYIRYIKDNLSEYEKEHNRRKNPYSWPSSKQDLLESLKTSLRIKTDKNSYLQPTGIYISAIYGNTNGLESLLNGIKDVWFVADDYIADAIQMKDANEKEKEKEVREWREFFVKLGVHTAPKIDVEVKTTSHKSNKRKWYHCPYNVYSSSHILRILEANDVARNKKLAELLERNWSYYKQYKQWSNYYYGSDACWHPSEKIDADWFAEIKTAAWLPTTTGSLATPCEIFLADPETVSKLGDSVPYLAITPKNTDFIKDLGIKVKIIEPKDYADWLLGLSQKKELDKKDEEVVLKIYLELNKPNITSTDWWSKFICEQIIWTDKGTFCTASNVFVNDHDEVYELFKDNAQIACLKLPENYYPKLRDFIKAAGISYLSQAVKTEMAIGEGEKLEDESLTDQIKDLIPYVLRYLYQKENSTYEQLKNNGTLVQLKDLVCYQVENLQIKYSLNQQSACTQRSAFLYNGKLYIQSDQSDSLFDTNYLALEISQLFGSLKGLDLFLTSLFDKRTPEQIEGFLKAQKIKPLPADEKHWFETSNILLAGTNFAEVSEETERNVEPTAAKHHEPGQDKRLAKSDPKTVHQKDEEPATEDISTLEVDTEWKPECEPREIEKIEALQLQEIKIISQESPSSGRLTKSSIPPSMAELFEDDVISENAAFSNSMSELTSNQSSRQSIRKQRDWSRDELNEESKLSGIWGEKFAVEYLRQKFIDKYPEGKLTENQYGFYIKVNNQAVVEIQWFNEIQETEGYDIKLIENGREEYIEVKSTKPGAKKLIRLSGSQWKLAQERGENFHIYRVYDAGTKRAKLVDIPNPHQLCLEGKLRIDSIEFRI